MQSLNVPSATRGPNMEIPIGVTKANGERLRPEYSFMSTGFACQRPRRPPETTLADLSEFFQAIVNVNRLEFPSVRKAIEEFGTPAEYARLTVTLRCDFLGLTYLLKNAGPR